MLRYEDMRADTVTKRPAGSQPVDARQRRFVGQGLHNQSLAVFGPDIEDAYQRLATGDGEFARCVRRFGYLPVPSAVGG